MSQAPELSLGDIDAVLRYLPIIGAIDFDPGHVSGGERLEDGSLSMPYFQASPELNALIQTLYDHNWIVNFDWPEWQTVAERYGNEPELLQRADLGTLRRLFTTHVRKERFCDGHLAAVTKSGHLLALLQRLAQVRSHLTL